MSYFNTVPTGDILSRITNDVDTLGQSLNQSVGTLLSAVVLFFGSLFMMITTNGWMTLAAVGASLLGFALMMGIMGRSQKYFVRQQSALGACPAISRSPTPAIPSSRPTTPRTACAPSSTA